MPHETRADLHIVIRHNDAGLTNLVRSNQTVQVGTAFINHARIDIKLKIVEEIASHSLQTRWTISVNSRWLAGNPGVIQQRTEVEIVIRMMMRDEM